MMHNTGMPDRVLVVDDEPAIVQLLAFVLEDSGFEVRTLLRGDEVVPLCTEWRPDVVVLDIGLPGLNGLEVCRQLNELRIPVLVLSSHDQDDQVVAGLEQGADDYVTKPFNHRELMLRIEKLIRRTKAEDAPEPSRLVFRDLEIDLDRVEVRRAGESIALTPTEFQILVLLARAPGRPVAVSAILHEVWGNAEWEGGAELVKVNIRRLRRKIELDAATPSYIKNRWGHGYFLAEI